MRITSIGPKRLFTCLALVWLTACGGSDDDELRERYSGQLTGTNCFDLSALPITVDVSYSVTRQGAFEGAPVSLVDQAGVTWTGAMTSATSFLVKNQNGDTRTSIIADDITATNADVVATTSCVSFRCCTPMSGVLAITRE